LLVLSVVSDWTGAVDVSLERVLSTEAAGLEASAMPEVVSLETASLTVLRVAVLFFPQAEKLRIAQSNNIYDICLRIIFTGLLYFYLQRGSYIIILYTIFCLR